MHRELELGAGNTIQSELEVAANQGALKRGWARGPALAGKSRSYSQTRGRPAVSQSKGRSMSPTNVKRPTLRRRPVKGTAAQVEPAALKAAEVVAKSKCSASYAQLQANTPTPKIADKAMAERIAATHVGQPPSKRFIQR